MRDEQVKGERPFVQAMARAMETQLQKNDHKNGRGWDGLDDVFAKLAEEVAELMLAASSGVSSKCLREEAADVANLAGMVVVYCGSGFPDYGLSGAGCAKERESLKINE